MIIILAIGLTEGVLRIIVLLRLIIKYFISSSWGCLLGEKHTTNILIGERERQKGERETEREREKQKKRETERDRE